MRLALLVLVAALLGCGKVGQHAYERSSAKIEYAEGRPTLVFGSTRVDLPVDDRVEEGTPVYRDATGSRLAYTTGRGARHLYRIGSSVFLGPYAGGPLRFDPGRAFDRVQVDLYELAATERIRASLGEEVLHERGGEALVRFLLATVGAPAEGWTHIRTMVPVANEKLLVAGLERVLQTEEEIAVDRAAREVDLLVPVRAAAVAARAKGLVATRRHPRTAGALLRATLVLDPDRAAEIACANATARKPWLAPPEIDEAVLQESIFLVLAATKAPCEGLGDGRTVADRLVRHDPRCTDAGPLPPDSMVLEARLCTKEDLAPVVAAAGREPPRVAFERPATRTPLFAYAALAVRDAVPAAFRLGHERRRYAIEQHGTVGCRDAEPGQPCVCDEGLMRRLAAEKAWDARVTDVQGDGCRFDADDARKKLTKVRGAELVWLPR